MKHHEQRFELLLNNVGVGGPLVDGTKYPNSNLPRESNFPWFRTWVIGLFLRKPLAADGRAFDFAFLGYRRFHREWYPLWCLSSRSFYLYPAFPVRSVPNKFRVSFPATVLQPARDSTFLWMLISCCAGWLFYSTYSFVSRHKRELSKPQRCNYRTRNVKAPVAPVQTPATACVLPPAPTLYKWPEWVRVLFVATHDTNEWLLSNLRHLCSGGHRSWCW